MSKQRVLIVWSEVPEQIAQFVVLTVDADVAEKLKRFNGQYINSCGTSDELADEMNNFFYPANGYFKFKENVVEGPLTDEYDLIIQCGFIL